MKWSAVARSGILISALSACSYPVMAQHHPNGGHAAAGGQVHGGNGGAGQIPAHVQRQMQQQQRMMQQQMQKMQQEAHRQYQQDVQRFEQWLKANGGKGGTGGLPNNPADFDRWAATQKQRKAQGKSYDAMYDQYRAFVASTGSSKSKTGHNQSARSQSNQSQSAAKSTKSGQGQTQSAQSQSGQSQSTARANRRNNSQSESAGSTNANGGTTTAQGTKNTGSTQATGSTTGQKEHGELKREEQRIADLMHEERRLAELRREERILRERALARGVLALDQAKVALLRTVLSNLQRADHDYGGHREQAMNSVGNALNLLGSAVPSGVGNSLSLGNMAQTQSDGILRNAMLHLRSVQSQLGGSASNAHHLLARASVGHAINHLEVALRVR
jgi:hypothetical protein